MAEPNALDLWTKTPRHFLAGVQEFVYKAFGDGHQAAVRPALVLRLGPAPAGEGQDFVAAGDRLLSLRRPLTEVQRELEEIVSKASEVIDDSARRSVTWPMETPDWSMARQSGDALLKAWGSVIWLAPEDLRDDLQPHTRRVVVDLPGRGRQPDATFGGSDLYFGGGHPGKLYAFAEKAGTLFLPEPLEVGADVIDEDLRLVFRRRGTVLLDERRKAVEYSLGS